MSPTAVLSRELVALLKGGNAHDAIERKLRSFPLEKINLEIPRVLTPNGQPITAWQTLEHLRIAQADILDFIRNPSYKERAFPRDYWPIDTKFVDDVQWRDTLEAFLSDLAVLIDIAATTADLTAAIPHANTYTVLRELMLAADHNSYHLGQIGLLEDL